MAEPAGAATPFRAGFEEWRATLPPRYSRAAWQRFWSRANALLGYDHTALLGPRREDQPLTVAGWARLLEGGGFRGVDVLLRDAEQVIIGARS
jgi:hypothetical protein